MEELRLLDSFESEMVLSLKTVVMLAVKCACKALNKAYLCSIMETSGEHSAPSWP